MHAGMYRNFDTKIYEDADRQTLRYGVRRIDILIATFTGTQTERYTDSEPDRQINELTNIQVDSQAVRYRGKLSV